MTMRTMQASFDRKEDLLRAADGVRHLGWRIVNVYSPYPLHETAELLGLARSRLPRIAFVYGALGVALAVGFQFWASSWDWPLNVGGRPWNSLPAFVPVTFETMVLCAGVGAFLTWMTACRLYAGKHAALPAPRVTNDLFVLEVHGARPEADPEMLRRLFLECQASAIAESERP
jgi:hypothetical protein